MSTQIILLLMMLNEVMFLVKPKGCMALSFCKVYYSKATGISLL